MIQLFIVISVLLQWIAAVPIEIVNYNADTHTRYEKGIPGVAVQGNYSYIVDGKEYVVTYQADDNGFRAQGNHLPVASVHFGAPQVGQVQPLSEVAIAVEPNDVNSVQPMNQVLGGVTDAGSAAVIPLTPVYPNFDEDAEDEEEEEEIDFVRPTSNAAIVPMVNLESHSEPIPTKPDEPMTTTMHPWIAEELNAAQEVIMQTDSGIKVDEITESAIRGDTTAEGLTELKATTAATEDKNTEKLTENAGYITTEIAVGDAVTESAYEGQSPTETSLISEDSGTSTDASVADQTSTESFNPGQTSQFVATAEPLMHPEVSGLQMSPSPVAGQLAMQSNVPGVPTMAFVPSETLFGHAIGPVFHQVLVGQAENAPQSLTAEQSTKPCDHLSSMGEPVPSDQQLPNIKGSRIFWIPHSVPHVIRYLPVRYYAQRPNDHYYVY